MRLLQSEPVSLAVIDPSPGGGATAGGFARMTTAYPSIPVLGYAPLTPEAFRSVAELSRLGLEHVILYSHDDSAQRLIRTIEMLLSNPLGESMTEELRPLVARLPVTLAAVIHDMFRDPHQYASVNDLAGRADATLARLYRSCHESGLASPKRLLTAARLLRAYAYLADPGHSVGAVSRKAGLGHPRVFAAHASAVFGVKPSRMRSHMTERQAIERLVAWLTPAPDGEFSWSIEKKGDGGLPGEALPAARELTVGIVPDAGGGRAPQTIELERS